MSRPSSSRASGEGRIGARIGGTGRARRGPVAPARARLGLLVGAVVVAVLALAWIDGGEEPIRPIAEPVETPATTASGEGAR